MFVLFNPTVASTAWGINELFICSNIHRSPSKRFFKIYICAILTYIIEGHASARKCEFPNTEPKINIKKLKIHQVHDRQH
jgi:hypothetical protein